MNRRDFLYSAAVAAPVGAVAEAASPSTVKLIELRYYRMRNGTQVQRTTTFLQKHYLPAAGRAGIGPVALFSGVVAADSPSVLVVKGYASFEAMGASLDKLGADKEFAAAAVEFNATAEPNYLRAESSLLRAFGSLERIDLPAEGLFELRTYESNNSLTLKRKIKMFEQGGEIEIFRKTGLHPVFFGDTVIGPRIPNLTYMVSFADMAARTKAWSTFSADPAWQKLRAEPGYGDAEIVSGISNSLWSPLRPR